MSCGSAARRRYVRRTIRSQRSASSAMWAVMGVITSPGATALTRTPCGPKSRARNLVSWATAPLEAP
ncbi:Uncharacterised protein [Mycobacterium tuberculosis]|nr:Uncharacterised protein [Mycobacterium tuberculosis]